MLGKKRRRKINYSERWKRRFTSMRRKQRKKVYEEKDNAWIKKKERERL